MMTQAKTVRQMSNQIDQCLDNCQDAYRKCSETIIHCMQMGGQHVNETHLRRLLDCAEICRTTADFLIRSDRYHTVCGVCAEFCLACAESCEQFENNDLMKACAEACRRCAESCQMMVANAAEISKV